MRGCFYNTIKKEIFFKINILVNTYTYYFGFIIALIVSGCSIPLVNNVSIKLNLVDKPEKRKQHKKKYCQIRWTINTLRYLCIDYYFDEI